MYFMYYPLDTSKHIANSSNKAYFINIGARNDKTKYVLKGISVKHFLFTTVS